MTYHSNLNLFPKAVGSSKDLERIKQLPRRTVNDDVKEKLVEVVTNAFRLPGSTARLKPVQAWALYEMSRLGGLLGPIGVGHGKTLLDILAPMAVGGCKVAVLLVPAPLKAQLRDAWGHWRKHFRVPNLSGEGVFDESKPTVFLLSYHELSNFKATQLLETIAPDLIICDEAHNLRHKKSARTGRVLRYVANHPQTRVCAWSGTLTNKSITEYAHISAICLKGQSPLPIHWPTVEEWALAIDSNPKGLPSPPGSLLHLGTGSDARAIFKSRFLDSPGVVSTTGASVDCSLYILERKVEVPQIVKEKLNDIRRDWKRPDGEEFVDGTQVARCLREMASGFYYRWEYPKNEPLALRKRWLEVRSNWHRELRASLKNPKPHLDSMLLLVKAAERHLENYDGPLPTWHSEYYEEWKDIHKKVQPITVPVWVDEFLLNDIAKVEKGTLIWYEYKGFEKALQKIVKTYQAGDDGVRRESGKDSVAVSILSHGTGLELQQFAGNLVANYPTASKHWEQFIGRTFRQGQTADEVLVQVFGHTPELRKAFLTAKEAALYVKQTQGTDQLLLSASYGFNWETETEQYNGQ